MPVLAKGDQGVLTGVCQNRIALRDSVDDGETNGGGGLAPVGRAFSRKRVAMLSRTSEIGLGRSRCIGCIDRTCFLAPLVQGRAEAFFFSRGGGEGARTSRTKIGAVLLLAAARQRDLHLVYSTRRHLLKEVKDICRGMVQGSCEAPNTI